MSVRFTVLFCSLNFALHAQTTFTGRVFDADTRLPLSGVEITVDTTTVITNSYGFFQVNTMAGQKMFAKLIGYKPQSIAVPFDARFAIPMEVEESEHQTELPMSFYKYFGEEIRYPAEARRKALHGLVTVYFEVDSLSKILKVEITKPVGGGCAEEVVRVLKNAPEVWYEIKHNTRFVLPVRFRLGNTKMKEKPETPARGVILLSEIVITAH